MFQNLRLLFSASNRIIHATTPLQEEEHRKMLSQKRILLKKRPLPKQLKIYLKAQNKARLPRARLSNT